MQESLPLQVTLVAALLAACSGPTTHPESSPKDPVGSFLVLADVRGTLKPCGCSPDLQRGGVDRVAHYIETVRKTEPNIPVFHAGDLLVDDEGVPGPLTAQTRHKAKTLAKSFEVMGLTAATLGEHDLGVETGLLIEMIDRMPMPIVVTNAAEGAPWKSRTRPHLLMDIGGVKTGIIGLVPGRAKWATDPREAVRREAALLRSKGARVVLALSSMGLRYSKRLLRKEVDIDLMLAAGQGLDAIVTDEVENIGRSWMFQSFVQGGQVGRIAMSMPGDGRLKRVKPAEAHSEQANVFSYQLTPISWDLPRQPVVAEAMDRFDTELKDINLAAAGELPPLQPGQASYVGVETCLGCHEDVKPFWDGDQHKVAWDTLERDKKTWDLYCVSCHTTGYGKPGGAILGQLKNLKTVQCESCHGPGSIHAESGEAADIQKVVPERVCTGCHNPKHSTRFDYDVYRARLLVPGHGG